jgi:demethylmenaquinone methyltransferase / 2-methoxy-6-polyprenyl-1,4-benzoquinol methylase
MPCRWPYDASRIERRRKRSIVFIRPLRTTGRRIIWFLHLMTKTIIQHDDRPESLRADETLLGSGRVDKSDERVRRMFGSIARRYDFLNHLLSLNIDRSWRRFTTRTVPPQPGVPVLDCCTGTADLALAYDRAGRGLSPIVGTDFCREMLVLGEAKVRKSTAEGRVVLVEGDTQRLPVPDNRFGVVSAAFGLRNVRDTVRGIDEMIRAARPGGKVAILEFSRPRGRVLGRLYLAFFRHILPRVGQAIAPNVDNAYHYLPRTVLEFPDGQDMLDLLAARGLVDLKMHPLTLGIATLYVGTKPERTTTPPNGVHSS